MWCPKFNDKTKIIGGYYGEKYSWLRLVLKRCDPKKRGANFCESREEQDKYVKKHKITHNFQDSAANTMYAFSDKLIQSFERYNFFSILTNPEYASYNEIFVSKNKIELYDDQFGVRDKKIEQTYLDLKLGI